MTMNNHLNLDDDFLEQAEYVQSTELAQEGAEILADEDGCPMDECKEEMLSMMEEHEPKTWDDFIQIDSSAGNNTTCTWADYKAIKWRNSTRSVRKENCFVAKYPPRPWPSTVRRWSDIKKWRAANPEKWN